EVVAVLARLVEDLADDRERHRPALVGRRQRIADVEPGLQQEVGWGDDLARRVEPAAVDQGIAGEARIARVADIWNRCGEVEHADGGGSDAGYVRRVRTVGDRGADCRRAGRR